MGVKTCEQLIKDGVRRAGRTYNAADPKPLSWLKDWLRSVSLGWPWPQCSTWEIVTLAENAYTVSLGATALYGTGLYINRVTFPIQIMLGEDILPQKINQQVFNRLVLDTGNVPLGMPSLAGYTIDFLHPGGALLVFNKRAKEAYQLQIAFQYDPAVSYEIDDVPWYLNDETMIQAIAFKQSEDSNTPTGEVTLKLRDDLSIMFRDDKLKFGNIENFTMQLNRTSRLTES